MKIRKIKFKRIDGHILEAIIIAQFTVLTIIMAENGMEYVINKNRIVNEEVKDV
jgi:ATP sulfurylase